MRRELFLVGLLMILGAFTALPLRAADAVAAPPPMPDLVDPSSLAANAPPLGALELPVDSKGDFAMPELPSDLMGTSKTSVATPTPVADPATAPISKASAKATAQAEKEAEKAAVQAKKASIKATAQAEKETAKAEKQPEKKSEPVVTPKDVAVEPAAAVKVDPTAEPVPTAVPAASTASSTLPSAGPAVAEGPLTGLEAYFPMRQGRKWNYTSGTGATMAVECVSREAVEAGGVKAVFKITTGTAISEQVYVLSGGKLSLAPEAGSKGSGSILLQAVKRGEVPRWTGAPKDGALAYYKAEAGPYNEGPKTLLDCITVTERVKKGAATVSLHKWVYARGIGVVADLTYGANDAPVPAKSFKLQEPTP